MTSYKVRAPVRIDFGGPWTDVSPYKDDFGGKTLNATINSYVEGKITKEPELEVSYHPKNIPTGAGLGTSGTMNVVLITLSKGYTELNDKVRKEIAEKAYKFESEILDIKGGKQDQLAAAFGGFNLFHCKDNDVEVERLNLPQETIATLENRLVLCHTGRSRLSSDIHRNVWDNYKQGKAGVKEALHNMKDLATGMKEALLEGKLDFFGGLININWENQKVLDKSVTNPIVESVFEIAYSNGALGGKACGAGGGGCLLFYTHEKPKLEDALRLTLPEEGRIIPFKFDFEGLTIQPK